MEESKNEISLSDSQLDKIFDDSVESISLPSMSVNSAIFRVEKKKRRNYKDVAKE